MTKFVLVFSARGDPDKFGPVQKALKDAGYKVTGLKTLKPVARKREHLGRMQMLTELGSQGHIYVEVPSGGSFAAQIRENEVWFAVESNKPQTGYYAGFMTWTEFCDTCRRSLNLNAAAFFYKLIVEPHVWKPGWVTREPRKVRAGLALLTEQEAQEWVGLQW